MRTCVVGMGTMGRLYAGLLVGMREVSLVAVCDTIESVVQQAASSLGVRGYRLCEEMLDSEKPDAVIITTPDYLHLSPALAAIQRGIPMMVEKPLAMCFDQAKEIVERAKQHKVNGMMAHPLRWNPPYLAVKQGIAEGGIGEVLSVTSNTYDRIFVPVQMLSWVSQTSPSWFLLSHTIDVVNWLTERLPKTVIAKGVRKKLTSLGIDTYDLIHVLLNYSNGTTGFLEASWVMPDSLPALTGTELRVVGTEGAFGLSTLNQMTWRATDMYEYPQTIRYKVGSRDCGIHVEMIRSFLDMVERRGESPCPLSDGLNAVAVLVAIEASLRSNSEVPVIMQEV